MYCSLFLFARNWSAEISQFAFAFSFASRVSSMISQMIDCMFGLGATFRSCPCKQAHRDQLSWPQSTSSKAANFSFPQTKQNRTELQSEPLFRSLVSKASCPEKNPVVLTSHSRSILRAGQIFLASAKRVSNERAEFRNER